MINFYKGFANLCILVWMPPIVIALLNPVSKNPSLSQKSRALGLILSTARKSFSPFFCHAHFSMYFRNFLPFLRLQAHGPSTVRPRYGSPAVRNPKDSSARPDSLSSRNSPNRRETFGSQFGGVSVKKSVAFCRPGSRPSARYQ